MTKPKGITFENWEALELERLGGYLNGAQDMPQWLQAHRQGRGNPMFNPICLQCGCELRCEENDRIIQHELTEARYATDVYQCPTAGCTTRIATGHCQQVLPADFRTDEESIMQFRNNPKE